MPFQRSHGHLILIPRLVSQRKREEINAISQAEKRNAKVVRLLIAIYLLPGSRRPTAEAEDAQSHRRPFTISRTHHNTRKEQAQRSTRAPRPSYHLNPFVSDNLPLSFLSISSAIPPSIHLPSRLRITGLQRLTMAF